MSLNTLSIQEFPLPFLDMSISQIELTIVHITCIPIFLDISFPSYCFVYLQSLLIKKLFTKICTLTSFSTLIFCLSLPGLSLSSSFHNKLICDAHRGRQVREARKICALALNPGKTPLTHQSQHQCLSYKISEISLFLSLN